MFPAVIVTDAEEADVLVTLRTYYRNREHTIMDAEARDPDLCSAREFGLADRAVRQRPV